MFPFPACGSRMVTTKEQFSKIIQKRSWQHIFNKLNMEKYVTSGVMKDINKFVETQEKVPFTMKNIYKIAHKIVLNEEEKPRIKIKANAVPTRDVAPSSETSGKPRIKLKPAVNNVPAEAPVAKEKLPNVIRSNRPSAPSTAQAPASNKVPSRYPAPNVPDEIRGTVRRPAPVPQNLGQPTAPATPKPSPVNPVATAAKPGFLDKAKGAIK